MTRPSRRSPSVGHRRVVAAASATLLSASLLLGACSGGSGGGSATTAAARSSTTNVDTAPPTTVGATGADATTPSQQPGTATPSAGSPPQFCAAAAVLQQGPAQNPTPEQIDAYVRAVESAADEMLASAPDRSIVPAVEGLRKAFALYTTLANADPNEDPAQFQAKAEEAERLFPAAQQRKFAEYVKAECNIELSS